MSDRIYFELPAKCYVHDANGKLELKSFAIRETTGDDEERAANLAKAKGGSATMMEELIQLSLVEVNDEPVNAAGKPYKNFTRWNSRARQLAASAWNSVNAVEADEGKSFLAQARLADVTG